MKAEDVAKSNHIIGKGNQKPDRLRLVSDIPHTGESIGIVSKQRLFYQLIGKARTIICIIHLCYNNKHICVLYIIHLIFNVSY